MTLSSTPAGNRRKPVPSFLQPTSKITAETMLPASHPFALSAKADEDRKEGREREQGRERKGPVPPPRTGMRSSSIGALGRMDSVKHRASANGSTHGKSHSQTSSIDKPLPPPPDLDERAGGDGRSLRDGGEASFQGNHALSPSSSPVVSRAPYSPITPTSLASPSSDSHTQTITLRTPSTSSSPLPAPTAQHFTAWDLADELDHHDPPSKPERPKSAKRSSSTTKAGLLGSYKDRLQARGQIPPPRVVDDDDDDETFSVNKIPSKRQLWDAGTLFLKDEEGELVCFGDFFPQAERGKGKANKVEQKTVVFFIRHFWCGQCQDYTLASLALLDPVALEKAGIRVIVISNGSWKIIKRYRELFNCPFPIYVDGPRRLYQLMGMTKLTNDFGPMFSGRATYHQRVVPTQLLHGLSNAFFRMPLANPGKLTQLGGEFILSPGFNCDFAHRMTTTSDHMEAPDILRLAGCAHPTSTEVKEIAIEETKLAQLALLEVEMKEWRTEREAELERMRLKKAQRRGLDYRPRMSGPVGLDKEAGEEDGYEERFERVMRVEVRSPGTGSANGD
ncbi:hypothetical protein P7C73_g5294, partial [Tremellales sp. Uapishka_1]